VTDLEKRIYNKHLAISRSLRNKPFKLKGDFTDFENSTKYLSIKRLCTFFNKYPDVNMDTYFIAPYKLYTDTDYFDLAYFASPRAIKAYTTYKNYLQQLLPDKQQLEVKESLIFISRFCLMNKIQLHDYSTFKLKGMAPEWVYHLKSNKINPYSLMEFTGIFNYINEMSFDERELLLGSFGRSYLDYKSRYNSSITLKPFLSVAAEKLKLFIDKNLNSSNSYV
jgi:hypothetical protein